MIEAEISRFLFYFLTGLPVVLFVFYGAVIVYFNKIHRASTKNGFVASKNGSSFEPFVSVVVATHNEEKIISKKIDNVLSSDYPANKIEIIFVDDSNDSTPKIIANAAEKSPNIHLLRFDKRMGYSPSMLAGCKAAQGEIVILNDAGSFIDTHAITRIVDRFQDPKIGVVTGNDVILNVDEEAGRSESLYEKLLNFLRTSETNMDSTFFIKGEATGVRKVVLEDIEDANETFDTTTGLYPRQKGFRVVFDSEVKYYEYAPDSRSGTIKQKTIRAANLIKVLWRFRSMMFNRKYGKYGSLTLPFNFASLTVLPVYIVFWFVSFFALTFFDVGFFVYVWAALGIAVLLVLIFSRRLLSTFLQLEYSLLKAIFQVAFAKKSFDKIDLVASTRR